MIYVVLKNYTQDVLAKTINGTLFQGPYAEAEFRAAGDVCDFDSMRKFALHGKGAGIGADVFIIQSPSNHGDAPDQHGVNSCQPTTQCLAAFLAAAKPYMYIYCQWDKGVNLLKETTFPEMDYVLGDPESNAVEVCKKVLSFYKIFLSLSSLSCSRSRSLSLSLSLALSLSRSLSLSHTHTLSLSLDRLLYSSTLCLLLT